MVRGFGVASGTTGPSNVSASESGGGPMPPAATAAAAAVETTRRPKRPAVQPYSRVSSASRSRRHEPSPGPTAAAKASSSSGAHGWREKNRFSSALVGPRASNGSVMKASTVRCSKAARTRSRSTTRRRADIGSGPRRRHDPTL